MTIPELEKSLINNSEKDASPVDVVTREDFENFNISNFAEISKFLTSASGSHFQTNALDGVDLLVIAKPMNKFSQKEQFILDELHDNHAQLIELESKSQLTDTLYNVNCAEVFSNINISIIELSAEQVKEGKSQKFHARDAVNTMKLFSKIEIYMLIVLALILQVIILYNPKQTVDENVEE